MSLSGIVVATITPMSQDGAGLAGDETFAAYYAMLLDAGVHGLFICGTTGEGPLLSLEERKRVAELTVKAVAGRVPVVVHVGAMVTAHAIELAAHAAAIGADGIAAVTPYFYPMDQEAIFQYYRTVFSAAPSLPAYLYNIPSFAGNAVTPELVARVRKACPSVVGMKHSDANLVRMQEFQQAGGPDFAVLSGSDAVAVAALAVGARGCVSGNASALPEVSVALFEAANRADVAGARREQMVLHEVRALLGDGLSLASFKAAIGLRGIPVGGVRAPHRSLLPDEEARLRRGMADFRKRGYVRALVA